MPPTPVPRLDGFAIQIKNLFYVFAGYRTLDYVHTHVDIYNFTDNTWGGRFDMPKEMAHSHLGMVTDGKYIYVVSGQYGPQCRGPIAHTFVLDTETKKSQKMPPLPAPSFLPIFVQGAFDVNIGANPSAEGSDEDEGADNQVVKVVDIVDTFRLQEQPAFDKKQFVQYMKKFIRLLAPKLEEAKQEEFKKNVEGATNFAHGLKEIKC